MVHIIRSVSLRCFKRVPKHMFLLRNKTNITIFVGKKTTHPILGYLFRYSSLDPLKAEMRKIIGFSDHSNPKRWMHSVNALCMLGNFACLVSGQNIGPDLDSNV